MFDINLFPFPKTDTGKPLYPGFQVVVPPKKPARGRENDILILYFQLYGKSSITESGLKSWLQNKAAAYHQSSGTVTSGIRSVFDAINEDLLERNSRYAKENGQISASLKVMVIKKDLLYFAICGAGSGFWITKNDTVQIVDDDNSGRGLGLTQKLNIRFHQTNIENGDVLFFVNDPPESWTSDQFSGAAGITNEVLYRRLFTPGIGNAQGVMIRFREGSGKILMLKLRSGEPVIAGMPPSGSEAHESSPTPVISAAPTGNSGNTVPAASGKTQQVFSTVNQQNRVNTGNPTAGEEDKEPLILRRNKPAYGRNPVPQTESMTQPVNENPDEAGQQDQPAVNILLPKTENIKAAVGGALRKSAQVKNKTESFAKSTLQKVLPGPADQPLRFPKALLIFIAVAVPVIIVAIIASIYIRGGRSSRFDGYLAEAMQLSSQAASQTDGTAKKSDLEQAIYWLDKADAYGSSDQSTQLRQTVQDQLDGMNDVTRINLIPAIGGVLPVGTSISQLAVAGTDLYALDGNTGTVLRFYLSGSEYLQDTSFDCGPASKSSANAIGKIVDIAPISTDNTYGASLLAIDAQGKLEYCQSGDSGYIVSLTAPDMGWVNISSIAVNQDNLYVLDIRGNAVYKFEGSNEEFTDAPVLFFDDEIPSLTDAIDIEVSGYELYILHSSGEMTECTYSPLKDMKSTQCKDPAPYIDDRSGTAASATTFPGTAFSQMDMTVAPDSSLYLLDNSQRAIYHFSYARNLQGVLYPRLNDGEDINKYTPTAFTVSQNRLVFIAFGSLVYYGQMP